MKKFTFLFLAILIVTFGCTNQKADDEIALLQQENAQLKSILAPPPSALDALYPPQTEMPVYYMQMMEMAVPMTGILVNLLGNDMENVMPNFEAFKTKYGELSKVVPEWGNLYPMGPVNELGEALGSGDQGQVMAAFEKIGQVCHDCHVSNMVKVQQKYHWLDFPGVTISDPLTNEQVNYAKLMQNIDLNYVGIMVDLQEGQIENALKHFEGFNARYQALKDTCGDCHGTSERKYYVDENIQGMIDNLGQALKNPATLNPEKVQELMMGIGMESCGKCHLVHLPAQYAKYNWKKMEEK